MGKTAPPASEDNQCRIDDIREIRVPPKGRSRWLACQGGTKRSGGSLQSRSSGTLFFSDESQSAWFSANSYASVSVPVERE
jgi:hypothetical protein